MPKNDPIHHAQNNWQLGQALKGRINQAHILVVPTSMYAAHSDWMKYEIEYARGIGKKILAVNPRAQERKASDVVGNADELVGWQKKSVVDGIWNLVRAQALRF